MSKDHIHGKHLVRPTLRLELRLPRNCLHLCAGHGKQGLYAILGELLGYSRDGKEAPHHCSGTRLEVLSRLTA